MFEALGKLLVAARSASGERRQELVDRGRLLFLDKSVAVTPSTYQTLICFPHPRHPFALKLNRSANDG